ncbi:hypothetical protein B0H15DRAFT_805542 [Mycena belliarum]|uniref:Uncharacterized protein n=1 Tax=Mycena belliarum TaxID=1033014 RepID=A0AAD6TT47_9AGAR|nr:hypothetical protein B0H15DRAFT_805542 [Mycena belliae]
MSGPAPHRFAHHFFGIELDSAEPLALGTAPSMLAAPPGLFNTPCLPVVQPDVGKPLDFGVLHRIGADPPKAFRLLSEAFDRCVMVACLSLHRRSSFIQGFNGWGLDLALSAVLVSVAKVLPSSFLNADFMVQSQLYFDFNQASDSSLISGPSLDLTVSTSPSFEAAVRMDGLVELKWVLDLNLTFARCYLSDFKRVIPFHRAFHSHLNYWIQLIEPESRGSTQYFNRILAQAEHEARFDFKQISFGPQAQASSLDLYTDIDSNSGLKLASS